MISSKSQIMHASSSKKVIKHFPLNEFNQERVCYRPQNYALGIQSTLQGSCHQRCISHHDIDLIQQGYQHYCHQRCTSMEIPYLSRKQGILSSECINVSVMHTFLCNELFLSHCSLGILPAPLQWVSCLLCTYSSGGLKDFHLAIYFYIQDIYWGMLHNWILSLSLSLRDHV